MLRQIASTEQFRDGQAFGPRNCAVVGGPFGDATDVLGATGGAVVLAEAEVAAIENDDRLAT